MDNHLLDGFIISYEDFFFVPPPPIIIIIIIINVAAAFVLVEKKIKAVHFVVFFFAVSFSFLERSGKV